ncbi:uncharacterized protein LOC119111788 [Pollicipes pollicipes]|uniref:uncharacterized protein LOC119111788 n=1 Tax=Pollicipes pollicipes TaxID=41117 RepID=UPI001885891E|nr:uncharacterized protein LOC119111788 [Pollicipes pollicipes]
MVSAKSEQPLVGLEAISDRFAMFLRGVRGGFCNATKVQRHMPALHLLRPELLPGRRAENMMMPNIMAALSGPQLAMEGPDGWLQAQQRARKMTAGTRKSSIRCVSLLITYCAIDCENLGLQAWLPRMPAVQERLTAWQRSMKRDDWEQRRHHETQAARFVDVQVEQCFLSVRD